MHTIACFWCYLMQECPPHAPSSSAIMFSVIHFWLPHPLSVLPVCSHTTLITSFVELLLYALFSIRLCTHGGQAK